MHLINYRLTTLSPIIISKNAGDPNMVATDDYIPGVALLGAFATEFIKWKKIGSSAHTDEAFCNWFLKGKIFFDNCYISYSEYDKEFPTHPLPLCLCELKSDSANKDAVILHNLFNYEDDEMPVTAYRQRYVNLEEKRFCFPKKSLSFHHERDYHKGSSKERIIFNYEQLDKAQTFRGVIKSAESKYLEDFITFFGNEVELRIGKSRATQYGQVKITFDTYPTQKQIQKPPDSDEIILFFTSPAIFLNEYGFSAADLPVITKYLDAGVEIQKAFLKQEEIEGYSAVWKTKKSLFNAVFAGSCLKLNITEKTALETLAKMQATGIGEKTNEGFGQFQIMPSDMGCQKTITIRDNKPKYTRPNGDIPQTVSEVVKEIVIKHLISEVKDKAINDCNEFYRASSQSITKFLLSRLESMVSATGNLDISTLRKPARDQLESIHNEEQTLKGLIDKRISLTDVYQNTQKLSKEINYNPNADKDLTKKLEREYWLTFFAFMRKRLKGGGDSI